MLPGVSMSHEKPMWYFTSPEDMMPRRLVRPSNSANSASGGLPRMLVSTLSRPRCAMPTTTSAMPLVPARWISSSSIGISASAPSSEKRFWPT